MLYNQQQIQEILPHRPPFLFVDTVDEIINDRIIVASYFYGDDRVIPSHFPDKLIMPGVLILEALGQAGAILLLTKHEYNSKNVLLAGFEHIRFHSSVSINQRLILRSEIKEIRYPLGRCIISASVGDQKIVSGELLFVFVN
jgi:3-hydroxyacyl-[acyl-carrier-protein] dehydratase